MRNDGRKKAERLQHVAELINAVGRGTEISIFATLEESKHGIFMTVDYYSGNILWKSPTETAPLLR